MAWILAVALSLLVPVLSLAQGTCPSTDPPQGCAALGPPGRCSNDPATDCTLDVHCGTTGAYTTCPDNKPRCVRWPFIDVDSDGCFDEQNDTFPADGVLPLSDTPGGCPDLWHECERAKSSQGQGPPCTDLGGGKRQCCRTISAFDPNCQNGDPFCCPTAPAVGAVCCIWDPNTGGLTPRAQLTVSSLTGLTAPAELKCVSNWLGANSDAKGDNSKLTLALGGDFRNYSWGAWKDHRPKTRFTVHARHIVLGGVPTTETHIVFDKDISMSASGCIKGGSYTDSGPPNEIAMNGGRTGNVLSLQATAELNLPTGKWSLGDGSSGCTNLSGCPLVVPFSMWPPGSTCSKSCGTIVPGSTCPCP